MFKKYIDKIKNDSNTNENSNDINNNASISMQRLDLNDEFDFDKLTTRSGSSDIIDKLDINNTALPAFSTSNQNSAFQDIIIRPLDLIQQSTNKTNNFIARNFSSITCIGLLVALLLGFTFFLVASISLIIQYSRPSPYYQFINGSDLINLVKDKNQSILFRVPVNVTIDLSADSGQNELCDLATRTLSTLCNYNIPTCHPENLENAVFETLNLIFDRIVLSYPPFSWSGNLNQRQIADMENFDMINQTYLNTDLVFYFEYFKNQTLTNNLPIKLTDINVNNTLENDLEALLNYCDFLNVVILNVTDY